MKNFDKIRDWDNNHCAKHVIGLVNNISSIFKKNNYTEITYIDIGANVGKVYDLLSKNISIKNAYLIEASPALSEYSKQKYQNDEAVSTYNFAICDNNNTVQFDETSMNYQFERNVQDLNLGLSRILHSTTSICVSAKKLSTFLLENSFLFKTIDFIKIDTESVDFQILNDLVPVLALFAKLPLIEFEINYFVSNMSLSGAQNILDSYIAYGYNRVDLSQTRGDGVLIPKHLST